MKILCLASALAALLALGSPQALAKSGASGTVTIKGDGWNIADAAAVLDGEELEVVFAQGAFDRADWAKDGKLDTFDLWKFKDDRAAQSLTIRIGKDNAYAGFGIRTGGGGGGGYDSGHASGVSISARDAQHVAGTIKLDDDDLAADIRFDLPIQAFGPLARPGTALPANGGEPGKALLAAVEARRAGDFDRLIAVSRPDDRAQMEQMRDSAEARQAIEFIRMMTPQVDRITGGTVDGDQAWVDFDGQQEGERLTGTAELMRSQGRWYVKSINTKSGS